MFSEQNTNMSELNQKIMDLESIGSVDIDSPGTENVKYISYSTTHKMFYIEYGTKNGNQAYGGGTIELAVASGKPNFLPIYDNAGTIVAIIYIYNDVPNKRITTYTLNSTVTCRLNIYAHN